MVAGMSRDPGTHSVGSRGGWLVLYESSDLKKGKKLAGQLTKPSTKHQFAVMLGVGNFRHVGLALSAAEFSSPALASYFLTTTTTQ